MLYTANLRRRSFFDTGFLLCAMIWLLALIPSPLMVPNVGSVGRPGMLLALAMFGLWALSRTHPRLATKGPQPVRWLAMFFLTATIASYASGLFRGMPSVETNGARLALIGTMAYCGVMLAVADGLMHRERLDDVLRVMLAAGAVMAVIGIVQSVLVFDITEYIKVPGLLYHGNLNGLEARGAGFYRVASTTGHYIEFGTVMAMLLPFAVHMGRFGHSRPVRQWSIIAGSLMFLAVPMTLSRTGIVALAVAMVVMIPAWNWRMRFNILAPSVILLAGLVVGMPGLLGTVLSLFNGWDEDPSVQGRADDYEGILPYLAGYEWFGRGQGTFIPQLYRWLDNQWLAQLVGGGVVGVVALATLHIGAIALAGVAFYKATRPADKHLAACLISAQMVAIAVGFTFDSLGFTTYALFLLLLTGAAGALWRFTTDPAHLPPPDAQHTVEFPRVRSAQVRNSA